MVGTERGRRWLSQVWHGLYRDTQGLLATCMPLAAPRPGMYTYRLNSDHGQRRLHLRVEQDGSGVLFVDVTDVIHLNPTATQMTRLALDGVDRDQARTMLLRGIQANDRARCSADLTQIYTMVERLREPGHGCATCAIAPLQHTPLFSTPVHAPYKADLALTYGCNNACAHCYNEADRIAMPSLELHEWYRVVDTLATVGVPHLILTGGEATLYPHLLDLIHYADQHGMIVGLNTNGRRLAHPGYAQALVSAGLNHVQITLGSCQAEVHNAMMGANSFQQTVRGIEQALASGLHTITNTTLMQRNRDHVAEIITFLHTLGIRTFAMNSMIAAGGGCNSPDALAVEELAPLLVSIRDQAADLGMRFLWYTPTEYCRLSPVELEIGARRCNAGEYTLCVEPDGSVLPCQSYYVSAGNILHDPWEQIWNSALFRSFRERIDDPQQFGLPPECWQCPDLLLCGGGCRLEREARSTTTTTTMIKLMLPDARRKRAASATRREERG